MLAPPFSPPINHFFVSIFIRDYVLRYGNVCDYYSLCGFMILSLFLKFMRPRARVLACLCARRKLLNSEGLNWLEKFHAHAQLFFIYFFFLQNHHECLCARARAPVFGLPVCACIFCSTWEVVTLHQWRRGRAVCAATVDGASERPNYSCVICFTSCLRKPPHNHPTLSALWRKHKIGLQWLSY